MSTGHHILIVDDRPDSVVGLSTLLTGDHHRVEILADSMEALSILARKQSSPDPFHLVFLDVNMPLLDGPGLVRELRRRGDRVPVAFITGYQSMLARIQQESATLGALGVLGKPPDPAALQAILGQLGGRKATASGTGRTEATDTFFGTGRTVRVRKPDDAIPSEGALARVRVDDRDRAAPLDLGAALEARTPMSHAVQQATAQPPRDTARHRSPLPHTEANPVVPPPRRIRTPDPSAYYASDGTMTKSDIDAPDPGTGILRRDPITGSYTRKPSGLFTPEPHPLGGTTSRFRRTVDGNQPVTEGTPAAPRQSLTTRLRRGVHGNQPTTTEIHRSAALPPPPSAPQSQPPPLPPPPSPASLHAPRPPTARFTATPAEPTRVVGCAHCQGIFQVLIRPQSYAVHCVHCGQLNRIDPE